MRHWAGKSDAFGGRWFFHDDMPTEERNTWASLKYITKNVAVSEDAERATPVTQVDENGVPEHPIEEYGFKEWLAWPLLRLLDKLIDWCGVKA